MRIALCLFAILLAAFKPNLLADAIIYQATGSTAAEIEAVVEQFRRDLGRGGTDNEDRPGPLAAGYREITWEDLPNSVVFPTDRLDLAPQGAWLGTGPGSSFDISHTPSSPTDPTANFGHINPSYFSIFKPFSPPHALAGSPWTIFFSIPGETFNFAIEQGVSGFGAVFNDVDQWQTTAIQLRMSDGGLGTYWVPAAPGDGNFSFLGIRFDQGELIDFGLITAGNRPLSPTTFDSESVDLVTIDNIIYSEPVITHHIVPEPSICLSFLGGASLFLLLRTIRAHTDCTTG